VDVLDGLLRVSRPTIFPLSLSVQVGLERKLEDHELARARARSGWIIEPNRTKFGSACF
jgi:hypothetical protein